MRIRAILLAALCCPACPLHAGADMSGKGSQMMGEILANPAAFVYDFQQDLEATTPLPPGSGFGVQTGIFPTLLPAGQANISAKFRLCREGRLSRNAPQLDLIGGAWNMAWTAAAKNTGDDYISGADFHGYYAGALFASSLSPKLRLFGGYKHAETKARLTLNSPKTILGTEVSSFDSGLSDDFFIIGAEQRTGIERWWSMQLNYGFREKIIAAKVSWYWKYWELGLNIYPEGVLALHPVCNLHFNF